MIVVCGTETSATNMLILECCSFTLFRRNTDGVGATDMQTGTGVHGDGSNFKIVCLPYESARSPFGHAVLKGRSVRESMRWRYSLCYTLAHHEYFCIRLSVCVFAKRYKFKDKNIVQAPFRKLLNFDVCVV